MLSEYDKKRSEFLGYLTGRIRIMEIDARYNPEVLPDSLAHLVQKIDEYEATSSESLSAMIDRLGAYNGR
jgi:hypothetical protein